MKSGVAPSFLVWSTFGELHRPAEHSRFRRRAVARKGSHQVDAILVPAAARAGREDEKRATVAVITNRALTALPADTLKICQTISST